ncbi:MAG TPA: Hsp20/alpha crystallin family protein [Cyclobacteriaceae bacterium]|jgi:HSP20 family molecular chaperone IbpA|nr:Hsp20/alpha crystallin family protein [Cyclobacteriaceae bacterium]
MKAKRFVTEELLTSIDVLNTLHGGVSEHQLKLKKFPDHREVWVKVPGVNENDLKAEIHDNILRVRYSFVIQSDRLQVEVPKVVYDKPIPSNVDVEAITASFEDDYLVVKLPFASMV